jgi:DNA-binding XRE family transcriptional regulator
MDKKLEKILEENTVSLESMMDDLTDDEKKIVEAEIRYYDLLVELRRIRKHLGLSQTELAEKAKLPRTTITKIESGNHNPTINTLMSIASAIGKKLEVRFV